jgi:hypothetical protein
MFKPEHGFTEEVKQKVVSTLKYYQPERVEKFLKKVGN